ncbi:hypothetical protein [Acidisoma cladoniae]|uniref:hypothetical protein n=1 Tax=Acidisoma cladoniae TaxID=3040935 RepID=UPI00254B0ABA|nr:hypothetical protein [Acidisoma sp. PAMC 29798]
MAEDDNRPWWHRMLMSAGGVLALSACSPTSQTSSIGGYWNASARKVIATTCLGTVYNGAQILGDPPSRLYGRCYFIHGPLLISDWVTGTSALVNGNALKIDDVISFSSNIVPGGLFLGEPPFAYQDIEGKWHNIAHLRDLKVKANRFGFTGG